MASRGLHVVDLDPDVVWLYHPRWSTAPRAMGRFQYRGLDRLAAADQLWRILEMLKKPGAERRVQGVSDMAVSDNRWEKTYPTLWQYLTAMRWDDGSPRQPSTMLVFAADGMLKGMVRDKDFGLCLWGAADSLEGLFKVLDKLLGDPQAEWRVDRQAEGQAATRVKKK